MASWTLSTSGACIAKAGLYANTTIVASGACLQKWSDEAEGYLCALTKKNWVTQYSTINSSFKPILDEYVSDRVAMKIIMYDMSSYIKIAEAQTILSVLNDNANKALAELKLKEVQDAMD
jgi:Holliday junction resolvasome RuvABC endonuclease subunit